MVSTKTLFVLLTAVASAYAQQTPDIVTLLDNPALSSLKSLITSYPDLVQTLAGAKDITVFAPSNEAIQKLTASPEFQAIANDQDTIKNILTYHVAQGVVRSTDLKETPAFAPTLLGEVEAFRNISGEPQVVKAALDGSNAVITSGLQTESTVTQAVSFNALLCIFFAMKTNNFCRMSLSLVVLLTSSTPSSLPP